ncbi:MAG TPA: MBL fold metallo-hydrolase [Leptospiraceae bacterium]|nr:MBL fold metallo-hydrolase [Leptospiraceae bacterium]HMY66346.1 MBL fold metallo-hydrolase [Leptospiraceae bacterium]HNF16139.1 MBL fold metallo-hydrolase [Leptospiraceae bacterium]HNF24098.1 MBL fold metallo-hydrolase [Leptospiraceae bacterium]HNH07844.1 MBL fold metallo-hydrolase [Leptospiraceae bacterium]
MKKIKYIYTDKDHKWISVYRDKEKQSYIIDTNEYIVMNGSDSLITDPGGVEIFPTVFTSISSEVNPMAIRYIFSSHQDPDVISSLSLWLEVNPMIKCYVSWLWSTFLPHFGGNEKVFISLPDEGMKISLGTLDLEAVPAHYLHSSGNFHLYDPKAKILFSGDIGAALLPESDDSDLYVKDFDRHIEYIEGFHRRWMGSDEAKMDWCERISRYEIDMLCPQHGLIYTGKDVERFINWFSELKVGITRKS